MRPDFHLCVVITVLLAHTAVCCRVDVVQEKPRMKIREHQSVWIPCSTNRSSCPGHAPHVSWFVFRRDSHLQLDLRSRSGRHLLEKEGLRIISLTLEDRGLYYCAGTLGLGTHRAAQAIGQGTVLEVTESGFSYKTLLAALVALLILYGLLILTFLICMKSGRLSERLRVKTDQDDCARRVMFSGVVQELGSRNPPDEPADAQAWSEELYQNLDN